MTALVDETFRRRAYGLGVDLYLEKPQSAEETRLFLDCIESLLDVKDSEGFRGLQTKGIVDLLKLEVFSQSSSVLRVTHGEDSGKVWFRDGQIVDAAVGDLTGEAALNKLIAWKTGVFDLLPAEPNHPRVLFKSPQELLELPDNQVVPNQAEAANEKSAATITAGSPKKEFVEMLGPGAGQAWTKHGVENAEALAAWADRVWAEGTALGEKIGAGPVERIEGLGMQGHLALARTSQGPLCASFEADLVAGQIRERMSQILKSWNV